MIVAVNVTGATQTVEFLREVGERTSAPPVDEWELIMLRSAQKNFVAQGRPDRWAALKPKTVERRRNKNKSSILILRDTGQLMQSLSVGQNTFSVRRKARLSAYIGTNRPGATAHQAGNPSRNLPQREVLKHQKEDIEDFKQVYVDHIMGEVK